MAEEDVARALVALEQDNVCSDVAAGTFDGLGDLSLTDDERKMVQEAAVEQSESDVEGFGIIAPHKSTKLRFAAEYASRGSLGSFGPQFHQFSQQNFGMNFR